MRKLCVIDVAQVPRGAEGQQISGIEVLISVERDCIEFQSSGIELTCSYMYPHQRPCNGVGTWQGIAVIVTSVSNPAIHCIVRRRITPPLENADASLLGTVTAGIQQH